MPVLIKPIMHIPVWMSIKSHGIQVSQYQALHVYTKLLDKMDYTKEASHFDPID